MTDQTIGSSAEGAAMDDATQGDTSTASADTDADTAGGESVQATYAAADTQKGDADSGGIRGDDVTLEPGTGEDLESPFQGGEAGA